MKKYIFYTIATVVTFLTFSCSKDTEVQTPDKPLPVDPIVPTEKSVVLSGTVDATKVSSDNNGAYKWQDDDIITILTNKGTNREFTAGEAGISTDFSGHIPDTDDLNGGFALYPASENHSISGTTITFNIPNELAWGADASYMPMYAPITIVEQKPSASFKAVGGALKLILYNIPSGAAYLAFTAASKQICGEFIFDSTDDPDDPNDDPVIEGGDSDNAAEKTIKIDFSDNYSVNKVFYIPLPVVTLDGGFTIAILDSTDGELFSVTSTKAVPIARNQLVVAKPLNCTRILWHEDFSQYSKDEVPGAKSGENYHGATGYACVNGTSDTKIWEQSVAGGTSPEILIGKSGGYFTATGINCSGINTMAITFKKNGNALTVSATDGITISGSTSGSGTKTLTLTNNSLSSFDLTFSAGSDNVRLDDIVLSTVPEAFTAPTISAGAEELTIDVGQSSASTTASLANEVDGLGINWKFSGANADKFEATLDNTTLTVTAKETNTSASDYTATLTLKATGAVSKEIAITQKTNVVPNPTVTVTPGDSKFTATWTADENATSYVAYLHTAATENPAEDGTNITSSISNSGSAYSITDYPATNGTGYHLYIKVNGVNEGYSAHSGYAESTFTPSTTIVWDLQSIAVTHAPTKTVYSSGEYFNPAGLEVTATFEEHGNTSNTKEEVVNNNDLTFSPSTSTALTSSDNSVTISYTVGGTTKTASQAIAVDCVALDWSYPASWTDGTAATSAGLTAISGVTVSGLGSDYAAANAPYRIKLDTTGDYIVIKTDSVIGAVSVKYKMIGGGTSSSISFQESSDGTLYTDVESLSISGAQNSEGVLTTTASFKAASRYVKLVFTKGSNVGIGGISITQGDTTVWDLKSIAVTTPPTKTTYVAGENFDPTGMVVTATYEDHAHVKTDKNETIANNALTFSPTTSTALTTENTAITITFSGKSTSQTITVNAVYAITIDGATVNGTVAADKSSAIAGATINLTASPSSGYVLDEWNVHKTGDSSTKVTVTNNSFTMPAYGVTVSATFSAVPTIGINKSSITGVAAAGVTNASESGVYSFYNGATDADVTVTCDEAIVTAASKNNGALTYTVASNSGAARDGWIKVQYGTEDPHTITVSQLAGAVTPTAVYTANFEGNSEHRTEGNNSYTSNQYTVSGTTWSLTYGDCVTTGSPLAGTANIMVRIAKKTTNSPIALTANVLSASSTITKVTFLSSLGSNVSLTLEYYNGTSWNSVTASKDTNVDATYGYSATIPNVNTSDFRLRFTWSVSSSTSSNRDSKLDNIIVYGY